MEQTRRLGTCSKWILGALGAILFSALSARAETDPKFYTVMATAEVESSPAKITLRWNTDSNATGYTIARRSGSGWSTVATLPGSALSWSDSDVSEGGSYEYRLNKSTSQGYKGVGFLLAGIQAPLKDHHGKVILLVDSSHANQLSMELKRLESDLVGDGWKVLRHDVSRAESAQSIKNIIKADYVSDPSGVKAVFILGHVAVPYSGNFAPDGHPDHVGAWTADSYYGDMDGGWSDNSVSNSGAEKPWNHNVPGDGKFDQSSLPSDVELAVGRVDFYNMTCFANKTPSRSEVDLLRAYLNKDHDFRHRVFTVARRGLVCDNFGEFNGEAFAASGWRNLGAFFGADNVRKVEYGQYFSTVSSEDFLWSYGTGGGSWYTCNGIGGSDDFATTEVRSVFTMFLGSYFGDWDNESAFLRAALGSGHVLTTSWSGRPHWFYHHMGLGEPIGVSTVASQNSSYDSAGYAARQVHASLLGDPTLRMHPVIPPSNLRGTVTGNTITLEWSASSDSDLRGYHVYRKMGDSGEYTRITPVPVSGNSFSDNSYSAGATYMVRAIKLERSGGGTYFNPSQGVFYPAESVGGSGGTLPQTPAPAADLVAKAASASQISLTWRDASNTEDGFRIDRKIGSAGTWTQVASVGANAASYNSTGLSPGTTYYFRVYAFNTAGNAMPSNEAGATTLVPNSANPAAAYLGLDQGTQGNWRDVVGQDGYSVITSGSLYPGYVTVNPVGKTDYQWSDSTTDPRALQTVSGNGRVAGCWYSPNEFTVDLNFIDGVNHKVAMYFLDWDRTGRTQTIELYDAVNGTLLDTRTISNFAEGIYLAWNMKGAIKVKYKNLTGPNAVLMGMFFDTDPSSPSTTSGGSTKAGGVVSGNFHLQIEGEVGERFDVYVSDNLREWSKISTVTLTERNFNFVDTSSTGKALRFYRAARVP